MIIPNLPCPSCGVNMSLEPSARAAVCPTCGATQRVKRYARADGVIEIVPAKTPKPYIVAFRVTAKVWKSWGGAQAIANIEKLVIDMAG